MTQRLVLWAANLRTKSFAERLDAAEAGGYREISIFPIDVQMSVQQGVNASELRTRAADRGIQISVLDPFAQWAPNTTPAAWAQPSDLAFVGFGEAELFAMAEDLGVESINLIETFGNAVPLEQGAERLAAVAARAWANGWRTQVEFMPFSGIPDLRSAWNLVRAVNQPYVGLTFDTWHYFRGTPDNDLLAQIPGDRIFQVQLADAMHALAAPTLVEDLLHHRLLPGEGEFPINNVVRILARTGGLGSVGVELFSDRMDAMSAVDAGRRTMSAVNEVLTATGNVDP